jgi:hypothetical protein
LNSTQLLNLKRLIIWWLRLQHEDWESSQRELDNEAAQIDDNLDFEGVITTLRQIFEKNGQPSVFEIATAAKAEADALKAQPPVPGPPGPAGPAGPAFDTTPLQNQITSLATQVAALRTALEDVKAALTKDVP